MRSGRLIRERVLALVAERFHFEPELSGKRFVWQSVDEIKGWNIFRTPGPEGDPRSLDEIPIEEIAVAIRCFESDDIVTEIARAFGNRRLTGPGRARIEAALALIRGRGGTQLIEGHST